MSTVVADPDLRGYWRWLALALFILVIADTTTTVIAAHLYGSAAEGNPLMRWALDQGLPTVIALNVIAVAAIVSLYYALLHTLKRTSARFQRPYRYLINGWLAAIIAIGLGVLVNNVYVILFGVTPLVYIL